jgi:hypothetical protein
VLPAAAQSAGLRQARLVPRHEGSRVIRGILILAAIVGPDAACARPTVTGETSGTGGHGGVMTDGGLAPNDGSDGRTKPEPCPVAGTGDLAGSATAAGACAGGGARRRARSMAADIRGVWYINRDGQRLTLSLSSGAAIGSVKGTSVADGEAGRPAVIDSVVVDASGKTASWCAHEVEGDVWYALHFASGVLEGRYARAAAGAPRPSEETAYQGRVTGWRDETFSKDIVPRAFDILTDDGAETVLRIDRSGPGEAQYVGTFSHFAVNGELDESPVEDVQIERWDGVNLSFLRRSSPLQERFAGLASGRTISGTVSPTIGPNTGTSSEWRGSRIEILSHGLGRMSAAFLSDWQAQTRARLGLLMMGGNPAPLTFEVTTIATYGPTPDYNGTVRDDAPEESPQLYTLTEVAFDSTVPDLQDRAPLIRHAHGYIAVPTIPPPAGGYPVVLALNGHGGSARAVFDPGGMYWYGDAFARRGYLVVAVDIGHRPLEDRADYYADTIDGDDAQAGNGVHPAIKAAGMTSDWEEDGERAWDAMRGLDHVLSRGDVNRNRIIVAGLSMGGEIGDWVSAMDVRVGTTFSSGSPDDLAVMALHLNHPCWRWQRADVREYLDPSDLAALAAPRTLVRETGIFDATYSDLPSPFAAAKALIRRARPAYDVAGGTLVHYLHDEAHAFRAGGYAPAIGAAPGVTTPIDVGPSAASPWAVLWETDAATTPMVNTIFDILPR